jgi:hypothetical protein
VGLLNVFLLLITFSFLGFFWSSFHAFKNYHLKIHQLKNIDTTALASSNLIAQASSELLSSLKTSINTSISSTTYGEDFLVDSYDQALLEKQKLERRNLIENYFSEIDSDTNSPLIQNINYGFGLRSDGTSVQDLNYSIKILHSDYLPDKLSENDPVYRSSLLSSAENSHEISLNSERSSFMDENYVYLENESLKILVGEENLSLISKNPDIFGIKFDENGININEIPNALSISISN